jgi:hypothetical protein
LRREADRIAPQIAVPVAHTPIAGAVIERLLMIYHITAQILADTRQALARDSVGC